MSPAQLEATADLNVHNAAREEGGAKPVEPEVWGYHHMSWGKPSVEHLADKHSIYWIVPMSLKLCA